MEKFNDKDPFPWLQVFLSVLTVLAMYGIEHLLGM